MLDTIIGAADNALMNPHVATIVPVVLVIILLLMIVYVYLNKDDPSKIGKPFSAIFMLLTFALGVSVIPAGLKIGVIDAGMLPARS